MTGLILEPLLKRPAFTVVVCRCAIALLLFTPSWCHAQRKLVPVPAPQAANFATPYAASFRVRDSSDGSAGSGVGIAPDLVVTNSHVVGHKKGGRFVVWHSLSGGRWEGTCIGGNKASDLALIRVEGSVPYVPLSADDPKAGDACQVYGYGRGGAIRHGQGSLVRVYSNAATGVGVATLSIRTEPGDSGSGVFTPRGELFAVNWGGEAGEGMAYATPVSHLQTLLLRICPDGRCPSLPTAPIGPPGRPGLEPMRPVEEPPPATPAPVPSEPIAGAAGQDGKDGADGKDGRGIQAIAVVDGNLVATFTDGEQQVIEGWVDQLAQELPPIYPQWIDNEGNVLDSLKGGVRLGQTMPLRIEAKVIDAKKPNTSER